MEKFVIIPDVSCDLNKKLRDRFGIPGYIKGVIMFPDGRVQDSDLEWETMSPEEFYGGMKSKKGLVHTAASNIDEIVEYYTPFLENGNDILSISISSALSGTYSNCVKAGEILKERFPDRRVVCVDSLRYSTALSLLVVMAAGLQQEGKSLDEVQEWLEQNKHCIHEIGAMDDLYFLCRTGRVSNFKAFFGTLVGVNPMADFNREGMSEVIYKYKGKQTAFAAAGQYMKQLIINPSEQIVFIAHSDRKEHALRLKEIIEEQIKPKEIIMNDVGMSCGASIGPGLVAAFFYGKEITPGLTEEKALMAKIAEGLK